METRVALSAIFILAGMTTAAPHPPLFSASCRIIQRDKSPFPLDLNNGERLDFDAPIARLGDQIVTCRGDLGPGPAMILNFTNTNVPCDIGPEKEPIARTKIWTETIKANGEATLICDFGPRP